MRVLATCLFAGIVFALTADVVSAAEKVSAVLNQKVKSIKGEEVDLAKYQGKVLLVVNVATRCGATKQYEQLESLNDTYKDKGLAVLGFPCNQFGGQEPGTEEEIAKFCKSKFDVSVLKSGVATSFLSASSLTLTLANMSNDTSNFDLQNLAISSSVPGS